jgi:hypothetical protein
VVLALAAGRTVAEQLQSIAGYLETLLWYFTERLSLEARG